MTVGNDLRVLANSIIDSYEVRVNTVGVLMNQANQLLRSFQSEIEDMTASLRDNLAKSESLRKKDFDSMMSSIAQCRRQTEEEAEENLKRFRVEEEEMISRLRAIVLNGNRPNLNDIESIREDIMKRQKEREKKIIRALKRFQIEQEDIRVALKNLLLKGENIKIKDLKIMLKLLSVQQSDRDAEMVSILEGFEVAREKVQTQWQEVSRVSD